MPIPMENTNSMKELLKKRANKRGDSSKVFKEGRIKTTIMYRRSSVIKMSFNKWMQFNKTRISSHIVDDKIRITVD